MNAAAVVDPVDTAVIGVFGHQMGAAPLGVGKVFDHPMLLELRLVPAGRILVPGQVDEEQRAAGTAVFA